MAVKISQVKQFHNEIVELIKKYQFRDRNKLVGCGLSVSQCYTLETLQRFGPLSMQKLADKMHLSISTVTRVTKPLVNGKLILKEKDTNDNRFNVMKITNKGSQVVEEAWGNVFRSERAILENFDESNREILIEFLKKINQSFGNWK